MHFPLIQTAYVIKSILLLKSNLQLQMVRFNQDEMAQDLNL